MPGLEALTSARVGVWGTGREGRAVARLAIERGSEVVVVKDPTPTPSAERGDESGFVEIDGHKLHVALPEALDDSQLDILVRSPGVSRYRPELERLGSRGVVVTTVTAMWLSDFADRPVITVTGSKGKTMTASLLALALGTTGASVGLGGNIGTPVTEFYGTDFDAYVIEVSSFQAAEVTESSPVGILTLLAPDHLDWHGDYEHYVADKLNLFEHRADLQLAVNARSDEAVAATTKWDATKARHLYAAQGEVATTEDGVSVLGKPVVHRGDLGLRGRHNLDNLCGAITGCKLLLGRLPDFDRLTRAISAMPALPSRLKTIAVAGGLEFVDDALASNPAGTMAALEAFNGRRVCLIAGGFDRGASVRDLAVAIDSAPETSVVLLGVAGERLAAELDEIGSKVHPTRAKTVTEAVAIATSTIGSEGVVLLSPAAPTPAEEGSFEDRSAEFRRAVDAYLNEARAC